MTSKQDRMTSKENGKTYYLPAVAKMIADESVPPAVPTDIVAAAAKVRAIPQSNTNGGEVLYGRIKRETEKAVLFAAAYEMHGVSQMFGGEAWWPKSQVEIMERAMGLLDTIRAPRWLIEKKIA